MIIFEETKNATRKVRKGVTRNGRNQTSQTEPQIDLVLIVYVYVITFFTVKLSPTHLSVELNPVDNYMFKVNYRNTKQGAKYVQS